MKMSLKKIKGILILFATVGNLVFLSSQVFAANIIKLDQSKIRVKVSAGQTAIGKIEVKNPSDSIKNVRVYAMDWSYSTELGEKEFFVPGTKALSCSKWITFAPAEMSVNPSGKEYVQYTIKVPEDAKGSYHSILFFESLMGEAKETPEAMAVVPVAVRVGCLVSVEVEGTVDRSAKVENLTVNRGKEDYAIEADFTNTANADITVGGSFNIVDKQGMVFGRGEFANRYTLAGDKVKISSQWKGKLAKGIYDLVLTLDLGKSLEEVGAGRGPLKVLETDLEVDDNGNAVKVGQLR
jgi:hypothetical protein